MVEVGGGELPHRVLVGIVEVAAVGQGGWNLQRGERKVHPRAHRVAAIRLHPEVVGGGGGKVRERDRGVVGALCGGGAPRVTRLFQLIEVVVAVFGGKP